MMTVNAQSPKEHRGFLDCLIDRSTSTSASDCLSRLLWNDLLCVLCVEWDVKLYSLTRPWRYKW